VQDTGVFTKKTEAKSAQEQMMSNPDMMTDMMKKNFSGIVPQVLFFGLCAGTTLHVGTLDWEFYV